MEWAAALLWLQLLLLLLDIAAVRDRLRQLVRLRPAPDGCGEAAKAAEDDESGGYVLVHSEGVSVPPGILAQARSYARQAGAAVLDLVPEDAPALDLFAYLQLLDVGKVRRRPFEAGRSAGLAILVAQTVLERLNPDDGTPPACSTPASLILLAKRLKRYAPYAYDAALCPGMVGAALSWRCRWSALWAHLGALALQALLFPPLLAALAAWGAAAGHPRLAVAVLLFYQLQPALALGALGRARRAAWLLPLLRLPLELGRSAAIPLARERHAGAAAPAAGEVAKELARRRSYEEELSRGLARFFEPRREDCPLCGSGSIGQVLVSRDHIQRKPGLFRLDRCKACGHVFQNPRLSPEGLSFYYRDAYEGLNEETMEWMYDIQERRYLERARTLERRAPGTPTPERWLDVGGCHGHFCCAARQQWPETRFELLDWSEAVEEAGRRGWADRVYRGQLLQLASELEGRFDVVSMSHYLEHTTEPWAEVAAARQILKEGGHLFIELPDPECRLGSWMGSLWQSWLQPQHLHLPPAEALGFLLRRHGFEVLELRRDEAHIRSDVAFFAAKALNCLLLSPDLSGAPWQTPEAAWRRRLRSLAWWMPGSFVLALGWLIDVAGGSLLLRAAGSNTYRLLAVRRDLPGGSGG